MSERDRVETRKAVRKAWEKERELVLNGKGTRDWTPEQQQSIIDKGIAYDDEGKAFEGQHMKSVEAYPDYQGDPNNIQLLTRREHLEAHEGKWTNPTNWYYDPITKQKNNFGDDLYIPPSTRELSNPLYKTPQIEETKTGKFEEKTRSNPETEESADKQAGDTGRRRIQGSASVRRIKLNSLKSKAWRIIKIGGEKARKWVVSHPRLVVGGAFVIFGAPILVKHLRNGSGGGSGESSSSDESTIDEIIERVARLIPDIEESEIEDLPEEVCSGDSSEYEAEEGTSRERASPREHDVSGYSRQQNGKTVHVNSYRRGGKNMGD